MSTEIYICVGGEDFLNNGPTCRDKKKLLCLNVQPNGLDCVEKVSAVKVNEKNIVNFLLYHSLLSFQMQAMKAHSNSFDKESSTERQPDANKKEKPRETTASVTSTESVKLPPPKPTIKLVKPSDNSKANDVNFLIKVCLLIVNTNNCINTVIYAYCGSKPMNSPIFHCLSYIFRF